MKIKKGQSLYIIIIIILLFGAAMNFQAKFFYFAFSLLIVTCIFKKKISYNNMVFIYGAIGVLMGLYNVPNGIMAVIRCFAFLVCYLVGYNVMFLKSEGAEELKKIIHNQEKKLKLFVATLAIGSFSHLMLNWINNRGVNLGRNTIDIWSGEILSATGQAAIGCLMVGFSSGMILYPVKEKERLVGMSFTILLLGYNLILGGRTLIIMYILILGVDFAFILVNEREKNKIWKIIFITFLLIFILSIVYLYDIGGIKNVIVSSNLYKRFLGDKVDIELLESTRSILRQGHLKNMFKYPFGGNHSRREYGYAHDLLLDAYDEYGILVFGLLLIVLMSALKNLYKILRDNYYSMSFKINLISIYMALLIQFCLEPIFAGMPWLFVCFCFLNGCIARQNMIVNKMKYRVFN